MIFKHENNPPYTQNTQYATEGKGSTIKTNDKTEKITYQIIRSSCELKLLNSMPEMFSITMKSVLYVIEMELDFYDNWQEELRIQLIFQMKA